ncbi:helix-turn-helix domain-containing protein [Acinetobacter bereziniae]|uniref:helix-turn-helix domain-containing protein n=1 Tax=Acinetobacter bereziniae TaxID=106648 RepID=UPI000EF74504|nr:helix-turn-helix transcriptional regulator [Acinetobacter bereziniae]MBJ8423087.1 helix-turn-helix transcriptional regulator [Acinetobacter bereziniae]MBJ8450524.1 helix-turn-helix transcriptional regulator [Acinetobacter bereziniae]MBJ8455534.1 helix-turn-helix transcriptional regulator [Acinetobacter bereziniae]MCU4473990.1 helix-turn-helix domain-containing protein [Acinetobacter bereziniae]MCU4540520.1 helix-turn-helix domain-containing protein [Acinetobacter bereziniae]
MTRSIHTDEMVVLRNWLRNQRKAQKITMRTLAERMDRPHSFVQRVEEGDRRLDLVEYVWYCSALGINPQIGLDLVIKGTSLIHS